MESDQIENLKHIEAVLDVFLIDSPIICVHHYVAQCIGATTLDEHRKHVEKDKALARRFQPVMVEEPSMVGGEKKMMMMMMIMVMVIVMVMVMVVVMVVVVKMMVMVIVMMTDGENEDDDDVGDRDDDEHGDGDDDTNEQDDADHVDNANLKVSMLMLVFVT